MNKDKKKMLSCILSAFVFATFFTGKPIVQAKANETYIDLMSPPLKEWDQVFGGSEDDYFTSTIATSDGGYLAVGYSYSTASGEITDPYNGEADALIAKFDAQGNPVWNHLFGGRNRDVFNSVVQTPDGGYIAVGSSYSSATGEITSINHGMEDGLMVKFDAQGNYLWDRFYGDTNDEEFNSIIALADDEYLIAGNTYYTYSVTSPDIQSTRYGSGDGLLMKLDGNGNRIWDQVYGGKDYDTFNSVITTSDGGFLALGITFSNASGTLKDMNNGDSDGLLVKFNAAGLPEWDQVYGGWESEVLYSGIEDNNGNFLVVGYSNSRLNGELTDSNNGTVDGLLAKFNAQGKHIWDQIYGGSNADYFYSLTQMSDGGYLVAGNTYGNYPSGEITDYGPGWGDALIVKFDTEGSYVWDDVFGGFGGDQINDVIHEGQNITFGGNTSSGSGDIWDASNGKGDGFIAKFKNRESDLIVTADPWNVNVVAGEIVNFQAWVEGTPNAAVQWQLSIDNGDTWLDIPEANTTTLSFEATIEDDGSLYRAKFSNYYKTVYSSPGKLTVERYKDYSGVYTIISKNSGLVMDVYDAGKTEGTNIIQWGYHGMENQQWRFESLGEGYYKITSVLNPDYSLDVYGGGTEIGNKVIQYHYHGGINQQWKVLENEDGSISLMSRLSEENGTNFVLDVYGGGKTEGVNVIQYPSNGGDNQKWHLQPLVTHKLTFVTNGGPDMGYWVMNIGQRLPETVIPFKEGMVFAGWYLDSQLTIPWNIKSDRMPNYDITLYAKWVKDYNGTYVIRSKNSNLVMDVYGGGTTEGTNIIQYSYHGMTNQQWKFESLNNGYYKITSVLNPEYSIDVYGGGTTMGNRVIQYHYHGGINQQWKILENADGTISLMSRLAEESGTGYLLDVFGGGKTEGVNVIQWISNNGDNQKWYLDKVN